MKTRKQTISDIAGLATAVFDNGRRGMPRPGCDCEQCFGYCLVDQDKASRDGYANGHAFTATERAADGMIPLNFND